MSDWPLVLQLKAVVTSLNTITAKAPLAAASVATVAKASRAVQAESNRFSSLMDRLATQGGMSGIAGGGDAGLTMQDLLNDLEGLLKDQKMLMAHPEKGGPNALSAILESQQKVIAQIREWGGPEGQQFTLQKFEQYLDRRDKASAAQTKTSGTDGPALSDATVTAIATRIAHAGISLGLGGGATGTSALHAPTDLDVMRAQEAVYQIQDQEDAANKQLDSLSNALDAENSKANVLKARLDEANESLRDSQQKLSDMADAAGVSDKTGVGAGVKKINDDLTEAKTKLQYMQDLADSKALDAPAQAAIDAQKKTVEDLTKKQEAAARDLRIATYDFEHSPAYIQQQAQIATEQAAIEAAKKAQEAEAERQKAAQARLDAEKQQIAALDAEKQKQQAIIDAKRISDEAAAAEKARKDVEASLSKATSTATGSLSIAAKQVTDATTTIVQAIKSAKGETSASAGKGDVGIPVTKGHKPASATAVVMLSTSQLS